MTAGSIDAIATSSQWVFAIFHSFLLVFCIFVFIGKWETYGKCAKLPMTIRIQNKKHTTDGVVMNIFEQGFIDKLKYESNSINWIRKFISEWNEKKKEEQFR